MPGSTNYSINPALWNKNDRYTQDTLEKSLVQSVEMPITKITPVLKKSTWVATNANINKGDDTYKVKSGNTLSQIISAYNKQNNTNLKLEDVAKWSGIQNVNKIRIGDVIRFTDPNANNQADSTTSDKGALKLPIVNISKSESTTGIEVPNSNITKTSVDSLLLGDSTKVKNPILDSIAVAPLDSGMVSRADSTIVNAPDSVSLVNSVDPRVSSRNFNRVQYLRYPTENFMQFIKLLRDYLRSIAPSEKKNVSSNKRGGTMNRINYFQQGGAAPQQDMLKQIEDLVKAAMSGDQKATKTINQIIEAAKAGNPQAALIAQMIQTVAQQMQDLQAPLAKWGSKLQYIRSIKYAKGGVACPACQSGAQIPTSQDKAYLKSAKKVEEKACGGKAKKTKKRYFGGWL